MLLYKSNKGGGKPVDFETAILDGFAVDGGLYVPEKLPQISTKQLEALKQLSYTDLAFEILSLFIDRSIVPTEDLKEILKKAYSTFEIESITPLHKMQSRKNTWVMELFYGPTISFKDIGLAFLVNLFDYFLKKRGEHRSIIVATTGDTGPATAFYIAGKSNLDAWVLYPKGLITEEQERQMTTLLQSNVHPVGVFNCPEGGDDLDAVIAHLYANSSFKEKVQLSSVNSINWGRVLMQTVHYFYGYLWVADYVGEPVNISVPSGAFGNLCAGGLARKMGLPVKNMIVANNKNACLHRIFSEGVFCKKPIYETLSSAIDILVPYNFWRYLYFCVDGDHKKINQWYDEFGTTDKLTFDATTFESYSEGFLSYSVSDEQTTDIIQSVFEHENYLLDPHGAVALAASDALKNQLNDDKLICLATAHPSKFPRAILKALGLKELPEAAKHPSVEAAKNQCQKGYTCDHSHLEEALLDAMNRQWDLNKGI